MTLFILRLDYGGYHEGEIIDYSLIGQVAIQNCLGMYTFQPIYWWLLFFLLRRVGWFAIISVLFPRLMKREKIGQIDRVDNRNIVVVFPVLGWDLFQTFLYPC